MLLYISSIFSATIYFFAPLCKSLKQFAVVFPLAGFSQAMFWPAYEAFLAKRKSSLELRKRVWLFNISWCTGSALGAFAGGWLYSLHMFVPFFLASGLSMVNFSAIYKSHGEPDSRNGTDNSNRSEHGINPDRFLYLAWISNFANGFTVNILQYIFPKLIESVGMTSRHCGMLLGLRSATQLGTFFLLGLNRSWCYKLSPLVTAQFLAVLGFLGIWAKNLLSFWIPAMIMIGVNAGLTSFSSIYYSLHSRVNQGAKSGINETIIGFGGFLGPLMGGLVARYWHLSTPYFICAVLFFLVILLEAVLFETNWLRFR